VVGGKAIWVETFDAAKMTAVNFAEPSSGRRRREWWRKKRGSCSKIGRAAVPNPAHDFFLPSTGQAGLEAVSRRTSTRSTCAVAASGREGRPRRRVPRSTSLHGHMRSIVVPQQPDDLSPPSRRASSVAWQR